MTQEPIECALSEQKEALNRLKSEFRTKLLLLAAVILALTVCAAGALTVIFGSGFNFLEALTMTGFLAMLTFAALADHVRKQHQRIARGTPEIFPPDTDDATLAAWQAADQEYENQCKKMTAVRILVFLGGLVGSALIPFALPIALVVLLLLRAHQKDRLNALPHSPLKAANEAFTGISNLMQWVWFAGWILCLGLMLVVQTNEYTAGSRVDSINGDAKSLYNAVAAYQADLDAQDKEWRFETTIIPPGEIGAEGSLSYGVHYYFQDSEKYWYAVRFDQNGNVKETYISRSELTESDLHPQTLEEQRELAKNPFHQKEVIGYFVKAENAVTEVN